MSIEKDLRASQIIQDAEEDMVIPNSLTAGDRKTEMHEPSKAEIIIDGDDLVG